MDDLKNKKVSEAAKTLSKLGASKGGKARAEALTPEQRQEIARHAVETRWQKQGADLPKETHPGILKIGDREIPCAVLENGLRVLSGPGLSRIMGSRKVGVDDYAKEQKTQLPQLPPFLTATRLRPFISNELMHLLTSRIQYKPKRGAIVWGYEAAVLPRICETILDAHKAGVLWPRQQYLVDTAELLIRALAHVGIIALVDEATGYQEHRDRNELHKILEAYISKELLPWAKRFPPEFYEQMFRLRNWQYSPMKTSQGSPMVGQLTNKIVYDKLPVGVVEELRKKNPTVYNRWRKYKHHQFLTDNIGHPHLEKHLVAVITLMRVASSWKEFEKMLEKAFPTHQKPMQLEMEIGEEGNYETIDESQAILLQNT